ncbi:helix-turn-helix domain-containing protein [Frankia sp. AgB1.9]|uniref:helix-turn-helix domain-containing protein n=1 Tax=unclassified Frankia TaxID=2632575 RepID=UPI0019324C54|nr:MULTISPECIES: helix-turn-helix domain-containing protein [unclassified Frankia]MBL7546376.1 helix-turn-helix domain-containing protein [Frankia sp. AgB1.9]
MKALDALSAHGTAYLSGSASAGLLALLKAAIEAGLPIECENAVRAAIPVLRETVEAWQGQLTFASDRQAPKSLRKGFALDTDDMAPWVSVTEASQWTGLSAARLRNRAEQGAIEARKLGRSWELSTDSLATWYATRRPGRPRRAANDKAA